GPQGQNGFAQGEIQPIGFALQDIAFEFDQGLPIVVLEDQIGDIAPIVPVIEIEEIFTVQGIVQIEVVAETGLQVRVPLQEVIFVEEEPKWVQVIVIGPFDVPPVIEGKTVP